MSYKYSSLDDRNQRWFLRDTTRATLLSIEIPIGSIRGLNNIKIEFRYPITAISGKNRSGKTTILAIAACGFHNLSIGYKPPGRKLPYYTFSVCPQSI